MNRLLTPLIICFFLCLSSVSAQTTYLPLHSEEEHLLERIETKSGVLSPFSFGLKPVSRKDAMRFIHMQRENILHGDLMLSAIDQYNIQRAQSISSEWVPTADGLDAAIPSKQPILRYFYQVQPDAIHVHTDDFFLVVNPVVYTEAIKETDVEKMDYINTRGIEARGRILNKIGFYTMLADDQERPASYVHNFERKFRAYPGMTYYGYNKESGNYDFFMARGYIDASFFQEHLNVTFGYDNNFSGSGIRSLLISDFSPPATFLRLRAHWNRFSYQSLFLQLTADFPNFSGDHRLKQKYAAIHQLNYQPVYWLNIGLFESSIFGSTDQLKATDLIPIIGYQTLARSLGTNQKTSLGLSFKAVALRHIQVYGQAYFDELKVSELNNKGWWGNQFGIQLGGKYFDAFTISNLDLQGEFNMVRPFTYGSQTKDVDYTHYNQPLAHPYGAGFAEIIGKIRYQPLKKLYLTAKGIYSLRGDEAGKNNTNGINPLINQDLRLDDYGYGWMPGVNRKALYLNFNAAFEIRPNIFFEAGISHWQWKNTPDNRSTNLYGGLRWNISRKEYDSY